MPDNPQKSPHHGLFLLLTLREIIVSILLISIIYAAVYFHKEKDILATRIQKVEEENKQQTEALNALAFMLMNGKPKSNLNSLSEKNNKFEI